MQKLSISIAVCLVALVPVCASQAQELTFAERVNAQAAIERIYYRHQIGATKPFEEAVPQEVLERKVTAYLEQSMELESTWHVTVTDEMLRREMERIARATRYPERLAEIERALHFNSELIAECLARPVLVQRLLNELAAGVDSSSMATAEAPTPECSGDDSWNNGILQQPPESTRSGHTAVWTGSLMIVWGGGFLNSGMRYDPIVDEWTPTSISGAPGGRRDHTAVWTGSRMIVWGGQTTPGASVYVNDGGLYDPSTDTWSPMATAGAPSPRSTRTSVWTGTELIVWGGTNGSTPHLATGGRYNPASNTWVATSTSGAPVGRTDAVSVWTGQRMIIWGGFTNAGGGPDSGARYDPVTDTWAPMQEGYGNRGNATAVWSGTTMLVWGGTPLNGALLIYDPEKDFWGSRAPAGLPQPTSDASSVWTGTEMIVCGGSDSGSSQAGGGRYNPVSNSWAAMSSNAAPSSRSGHTAVWTGSKMIVWGGSSDVSGGQYDPQNDTWTPTSLTGSPLQISRRRWHSAVWTGNVMVVWGGLDPGTPRQSGGRYDPLLDAWAPTSLTNAPGARINPTAVWTGQKMLVWGGLANSAGGSYDPIADTWTAMSRVGEPNSYRWYHTAVWTGTRMIVFGGEAGFVAGPPNNQTACDQLTYADGGSYDPAADTWTSLAPGGPGKRAYSSAVWTGSKMIVWGGMHYSWYPGFPPETPPSCGVFPDNLGGVYDPSTNTWAAVSLTGAPTAKYGHSAVWTGDRMIVYGAGGIRGGRYDPASDTWGPVSALNAPAASSQGVGVWTGSEMIFWNANPGGRYSPATDSWTPMSTVNAPPATDAKGVWTGDAMLVWGTSGGGRYFVGRPDADHDGIADTCDPCLLDPVNDDDADGLCGNVDNCPFVPNVNQADGDGDAVGDACDNCPTVANQAQANGDADTLGDACDNCPSVTSANQLDGDADGDGDACDNCPSTPNSAQADGDADGAGDACDCQPQDPNDRAPAEVVSLAVGKSGTLAMLSWTPVLNADGYSITRGALSSMAAGQYGSCLQQGVTGTSFTDADAPLPGQGFAYLVQAQNFDCGLGSLGLASGGQPRANADPSACAGAAVSDAHLTAVSVVLGTLGGSGSSLSSNDVYLTVREVLSGGTSQLDGRFTFNVAAGSLKELHVEGFRTNSTDGDNFRFEYSTNGGGSFTPVVLSLPSSDDDIDRVAALPGGISGTVIVRVVDTDRTAGHNSLDIVAIDEIWIRSVP